jgi:serine protease AprX
MAVELLPLTIRRLAACALGVAALACPATAHAAQPQRSPTAEAIVQFDANVSPAVRRATVRAAGAKVVRDLHVIRGLGVRAAPWAAARLARMAGVRAVTANAAMRPAAAGSVGRWGAWDPAALSTAFVQSTRADKVWTEPRSGATGTGVAVAVIDTGIAGDLPDFRQGDSPGSRVIASAVTNPDATTAGDGYGHGTHVAGLIAGNSRALPTSRCRTSTARPTSWT